MSKEDAEKKPAPAVELRATHMLNCAWICPDCGRSNYETFFNPPRDRPVKCNWCGHWFTGSLKLG